MIKEDDDAGVYDKNFTSVWLDKHVVGTDTLQFACCVACQPRCSLS